MPLLWVGPQTLFQRLKGVMVRFHTWLSGLMVHRDEVKPDPMNPNWGDVEKIAESLVINGCYRPVYASKETKHIVGGHNLYEALLSEGAVYLPVAWLDGDDAQARRILVGDNQIARLARMDDLRLLQLVDTLKESDLGLAGTGFDDFTYERLVGLASPPNDGGWFPSAPEAENILRQHECPACGHTWSD